MKPKSNNGKMNVYFFKNGTANSGLCMTLVLLLLVKIQFCSYAANKHLCCEHLSLNENLYEVYLVKFGNFGLDNTKKER